MASAVAGQRNPVAVACRGTRPVSTTDWLLSMREVMRSGCANSAGDAAPRIAQRARQHCGLIICSARWLAVLRTALGDADNPLDARLCPAGYGKLHATLWQDRDGGRETRGGADRHHHRLRTGRNIDGDAEVDLRHSHRPAWNADERKRLRNGNAAHRYRHRLLRHWHHA